MLYFDILCLGEEGKMLHTINALHLINMESETHYSFRTCIPTDEYPQVHDFYEFFLVTAGKFTITIEGVSHVAVEGDFFMICPGTIHGKYAIPETPSSHINIAFFSSTMRDLCQYLYGEEPETVLPPKFARLSLEANERNFIQSEMEYLNLIPVSESRQKRTFLRQILIHIVYTFLVPRKTQTRIIPLWLQQTVDELQKRESLCGGLQAIVQRTELSEAYICRTFKKYFNVTPTQYINTIRLNYVANMLIHSDREIERLCDDVGFSSLSYFYAQFKRKFGISPAQYRKRGNKPYPTV